VNPTPHGFDAPPAAVMMSLSAPDPPPPVCVECVRHPKIPAVIQHNTVCMQGDEPRGLLGNSPPRPDGSTGKLRGWRRNKILKKEQRVSENYMERL